MEKGEFVDIMGSHLREDERVREKPIGKRKIFTSELHEIIVYAYGPVPAKAVFSQELVCVLVKYFEDRLRIMIKVLSVGTKGDPEKAIDAYLKILKDKNTNPLMLVRQAKDYCNIPLSRRDIGFLVQEGIDADKK